MTDPQRDTLCELQHAILARRRAERDWLSDPRLRAASEALVDADTRLREFEDAFVAAFSASKARA